jgi:GT2 family glycosyltransferase
MLVSPTNLQIHYNVLVWRSGGTFVEFRLIVSIIIPALHRPDLTQRCLDALARQTLPQDSFEAIIVENAATPDSIFPDPLPQNTRRILLDENLGTTGSVNRAVATTSSDYILLLNNDVELDPDFLRLTIEHLETNPSCGFVTGKLLSAKNREQLDGAGDALLVGGGSYRLGHLDRDIGQFDTTFPVIAGCGAATLFRRSVFERIGGLDEDFFAYVDDVDLCLRARLAGYTGMYLPEAIAYHLGSATFGDPIHPRITELITRNQLLLIVKDYPVAILIRTAIRILVYQFLWMAVACRRSVKAYFKGLFGVLLLMPKMLRKRREIRNFTSITTADFLRLVEYSEDQICKWHNSIPPAHRSRLLRAYFAVFS